MNLSHVFVIARNVFREVIRDRVLYVFGLFAIFLLAAQQLLLELASIAADKIFLDVGLAAIAIVGLFVTVFVGTGLMNKEFEKRTVFVLLAKPITRVEMIVGKHLGLSLVIATLLTMMTAWYYLVIWIAKVEVSPGVLPAILVSILFLLLELSLIVAVAIVFGVATSSLLAVLLTFSVYLMGHFSENMVQIAGITENPAFIRFAKGLYLILPDLSRLNFRNVAVYNDLPGAFALSQNALYGIIYTVALLAIASLIFTRREF